MQIRPKNFVIEPNAALAQDALEHFEGKLRYETDCWDVHAGLRLENPEFVLIDVRSKALFDRAHIPGAIHIPHSKLTDDRLQEFARDLLFVVYCAGPHCNGSTRAAIRLARLSRPVKEMPGGIEGWRDEGFELVSRR